MNMEINVVSLSLSVTASMTFTLTVSVSWNNHGWVYCSNFMLLLDAGL